MRVIPRGAAPMASALFLLLPRAALAQDPPAATELLAAEDLRFQAELQHDATALDRMTASDVVYSHATGQRDDKAAVMRAFTHLPFTAITPTDRYARVVGDIGIVRGNVVRQLPGHTLNDGYLAIYEHRAGRWQLLEWVSAAPSAPKPATP